MREIFSRDLKCEKCETKNWQKIKHFGLFMWLLQSSPLSSPKYLYFNLLTTVNNLHILYDIAFLEKCVIKKLAKMQHFCLKIGFLVQFSQSRRSRNSRETFKIGLAISRDLKSARFCQPYSRIIFLTIFHFLPFQKWPKFYL